MGVGGTMSDNDTPNPADDEEPRIDADDVRSELADHDADDETDQNYDALDENTRVKGKYALYTGDRPLDSIGSHWSIREVWAAESDITPGFLLSRGTGVDGGLGWYDGVHESGWTEVKSAAIDQSGTSRYVVREHQHERLNTPDGVWNIPAENEYVIVVSQRLGPRIHHTVDSVTVDLDTMTDLVDQYSWVDHGRSGIRQCYIPWSAHDGLDDAAVNERARVVRRVYDLLRDAEHPEAVRDEIRRLTDLMDLLDQYES